MNVLLVEDDLDLCDALSRVLLSRGFQIVCCSTGLEGLALARRRSFDALILDLSLPGVDGLEVLQRLRDGDASVPVLIVTARGSVSDKVHGLEVGADDYLSKPFDVEELVARVKALIRRRHGDDLRCGSLWLDAKSGIFYSGMRPLELSPREASLLKALLERQGKAVSKEALRESVFGPDAVESSEAVEVLVHRLRKRLIKATVELVTLRGLGYLLIDQTSMSQESEA
ncbi:response regulator transcription factor [Acidovorax sp.]|jgi:DNA-binding response OmpR family regulator|uniref:response regulator transcription factor n=1 Tax=Acidovorax sp. TaxID=1872122 RepID=UPI00391F34D1